MMPNGDSDEAVIACIPAGFRSSLIGIAMAKKWLQGDDLSVADRLHHLEFVRSQAFGVLTAEAVAAIEPASDTFEQIFTEAMRVNPGDNQCETAFGILDRDEIFADLVRLNPSISGAIRLCRGRSAAARE
jgi:hypothetical protein